MGPKGVLLLPGELIKLTYPRFGFDNKVFRISNLNFTSDCLTQVTAIEHDDDSYKIGKKARNRVVESGQAGGGGQVEIPTPESPTSLVATAGKMQVSLVWTNAVRTSPDWKTEILRHTSDVVASATVLHEVSIDKNSYVDQQVVAGTTYYYWVRHYKTIIRPNGSKASPRSATFPVTNGRAATVQNPDIQNQATAEIYFNSTAAEVDDFPDGSLPANINGFPNIVYDFTTTPGIDSVSSGSITNDQIVGTGNTGWYRKPQLQTGDEQIFAIPYEVKGTGTTATITPANWEADNLYIWSKKVAVDHPVGNGTNLTHLFIMDSSGATTNDFSCGWKVQKGGVVYQYSTTETSGAYFDVFIVSVSGGVTISGQSNATTGEVIINSSTGAVSINGTSDIIDTATVTSAEIEVALRDRGDSNKEIQTFTILLEKIPLVTRDGITKTYTNATHAAAWKGTLTDAAAQAIAGLAIADTSIPPDGKDIIRRIVPNDRITVKSGTTVATRIYTGAATGTAGNVSASSFSSVVTAEFDGCLLYTSPSPRDRG